jgi:ANTAR domain-containing protein
MSELDPRIREMFVELTGLLVDEVDIPSYLARLAGRCIQLKRVDAAGVLVVRNGALDVGASSGESAELLTRFELAYDEGPGLEAFRRGVPVECLDALVAARRWPRWSRIARDCGVGGILALPCRRRTAAVGALILYSAVTGALPEDSAEAGRALANVVSLGVTAQRGREAEVVAGQLQTALDSRVAIEQAKGMLAERTGSTVAEAFTALRRHARGNGMKLNEVARAVVAGELGMPSTARE